MKSSDKNEYLLELGKRIREERKQRGMTLEELALASGYTSRSSMATIEAGKRDISTTKVVAIANALDVSPLYLSTGEKDDFTLDYEIQKKQAAKRLSKAISNTAKKHKVVTVRIEGNGTTLRSSKNKTRAELYKRIKMAEIQSRYRSISDEEMILINAFREMSPEEKETIMNLVKVFAKSNKKLKR